MKIWKISRRASYWAGEKAWFLYQLIGIVLLALVLFIASIFSDPTPEFVLWLFAICFLSPTVIVGLVHFIMGFIAARDQRLRDGAG